MKKKFNNSLKRKLLIGEKWPDKSTTSYAMLNFESDIQNL